MVTWDEERKRLGISSGSGTNFSAGQPDVDKKSGITSWDEERIRLGALPDIRPSTQLRKNLPSPMQSGFGGLQNTTLGQAAAGNPTASATYRQATGITLRPNNVAAQQQKQTQLDDKTIQQARDFFGNGITDNVLVPITNFVDNSLFGKAATRTSLSAANALNLYPDDNRAQAQNRPSTGSKVFDTALDIGGALGGYASNPAGVGVAGQGLLAGSYGVADKLTGAGTKLGGVITNSVVKGIDNPGTQRLLNTAINNGYRGGIAGGIAGVNSSLIRGESSPQDIGVSAATGVGFGAIGDAVFGGLAQSAIKKLFQSNKLPMKEAEEILGLPMASKQSLARSGQVNRLPDGEGVISNPYTFQLPEATPSTVAATNRFNTNVNRLSQLDNELSTAEARQAQAVIDEYKSLKQIRDTKGLKPSWYMQLNEGKRPTNRQLFELAGSRVMPEESLNASYANLQRRNLQNEVDQFGNVTTSSPTKVTRLSTNTVAPESAPVASVERARTATTSQEPVNPAAVKADDYEPPAAFVDRTAQQEANVSAAMPDNVPVQQSIDPINPANRTPITNPENERGFVSTLANSDKTPDEFVQQLRNSDNATYEPITNPETLGRANSRLNNIQEARSFVMGDSRFTAEKAATAQRLIDHYNSRGMFKDAVEVAEKLSEEATNAGQFIQSLAMYNRLSPEGLLTFVNNRVKKINERRAVTAEKAVVTDQVKRDVIEIATIARKMTGIRQLSNDVIDIVARAKNGEKLSREDTAALQTFIKDAQTFVKDATKKMKPGDKPAINTNPTKRQQVTSFLNAQEQAARDRIAQRRNRLSSTPLDVWADYAIIGASKIGKGVIKFADWSEEMVKDLGEDIRPMLPALYERSKEAFTASKKQVTKLETDTSVKLVNKLIRDQKLDDNDGKTLSELARKVAALSGEEKRVASQDLQKILQEFDRPTIGRKISSLQTIAQLANPKTILRNAVGNELFYLVERLTKLIASPIDAASSKLTGKQRYITFKTNNQGEYLRNFMLGWKAGWNGININGLQSQFDLQAPAFKSKYNPATYAEKFLGATLRSFDNAGYMRAYNHALGEMGTLDAINKGIVGKEAIREHVKNYVASADDAISNLADQYGRYVTFQDNNTLSKSLSGVKRFLNAQRSFGFGDIVIKYPKTPGALLMRALEYSPVGVVRSLNYMNRAIRHLEKDKAPEAAMALARAFVGTAGFSVGGYILMDNGILTTAASKDKDVRNLSQNAGQTQYQINFSALKRFVNSGFKKQDGKTREGDFLYTYDWAQPVALSLSVGAEINKNIKEGKEAEKVISGLGGVAVNSISGGINTLTEQSVLSGIKDAFSGYPGQTVSDKFIDIISTVPASFIPTIFNQIRQVQSNDRRETYSPNKIEQSLNRAGNRIPFVSQKLPLQYDSLGNVAQTYQDPSLFNIFINPGNSSRYKLSPNAQMVMDLINNLDDESLAPRVPDKTIQGNKLTGEQYSRLSQVQGQFVNEGLSNLNPEYSDAIKARVIDDLLRDSGKRAREQIFKEYNLTDNRKK